MNLKRLTSPVASRTRWIWSEVRICLKYVPCSKEPLTYVCHVLRSLVFGALDILFGDFLGSP